MATRDVHGGLNSMFSGNIFRGSVNIKNDQCRQTVNEKSSPPWSKQT